MSSKVQDPPVSQSDLLLQRSSLCAQCCSHAHQVPVFDKQSPFSMKMAQKSFTISLTSTSVLAISFTTHSPNTPSKASSSSVHALDVLLLQVLVSAAEFKVILKSSHAKRLKHSGSSSSMTPQ